MDTTYVIMKDRVMLGIFFNSFQRLIDCIKKGIHHIIRWMATF